MKDHTVEDKIEKTIELKAPVSRVWRALTDYREFSEWFLVNLDKPFVVGEVSGGNVTYPGYEHMILKALVKTMEPERLFRFVWCPYNDPPDGYELDGSTPETTVTFELEAIPTGTRLKVTESGFSALDDRPRALEAMRLNDHGWNEQMKNITAYVES